MALKGYTRLDLLRDNKVVKRIEKHNAITPWVQSAIRQGNFNMAIPYGKIMPLKQWFEGCLLTDNENDDTLSMIAHNSSITAQASNDAYSGDNMKRGIFNTNESGEITGGYRFVWDWLTSQGNGVISSVCLTRASIGASELSETATAPQTNINEQLFFTGMNASYLGLGKVQIIDYTKETGYNVTYSSGTITIEEYDLSTYRLHLLDEPMKARLKATHNISQTVSNYGDNHVSLSYTGDAIHFVTWSGSVVTDYVISTSTWEVTETITRTFTGVTFQNYQNNYQGGLHKDVAPIIGDYIWLLGTVSGVPKMLKCNLLGDQAAEIFEYSIPISAGIANNGCSIILPNNDFYKFGAPLNTTSGLYYHNDTFYHIKQAKFGHNWGNGFCEAGYDTGMGTIITTLHDTNQLGGVGINALFPYVSTVNNLENAVTKSADLTMKLTYEITEVAS